MTAATNRKMQRQIVRLFGKDLLRPGERARALPLPVV
jgi:hypothetical protein